MKKIIVIILAVFFHQSVLLAQRISNLPDGLNIKALSDSLLTGAFTRLHQYSDYIYNSNKLLSVDSTGYVLNRNETWGPGSWGRGYFSWYVDRFLFSGDSSKVNYNRWYKERWSCHPLVRDNARRVVAYVYRYKTGDRNREYVEKIAAGVNYLVEQQNNNKRSGSFLWWNFRKVMDKPDTSEIPDGNATDAEYETALALYALTEGYLFLKQFHDPANKPLLERALSAIHISAKWCFVRSLNYDATMPDPKYYGKVKPSINYRAFTLLGLAQAYRVTSDPAYLRRAADIYVKCIKDFQDENGTWYYPDNKGINTYHDAKPYYMGITLRGLVLLHELLEPTFNDGDRIRTKTLLANSIYSTINHFLVKGNAGPNESRLDRDGRIRQYKMEGGANYKISGAQFNQGIKYALESSLCSDRDKKALDGILNSSLRATANEVLNGYLSNSSEVDMLSLSMYGCMSDDFFSKPQSQFGLVCYRNERSDRNAVTVYKPGSGQVHQGNVTAEKEFDLIAAGDFDHDGTDDVAFYRKSDGKIMIYKAGSGYDEKAQAGTIDTNIKTFGLMQPLDYDHDGFPEIVLYSIPDHLIHIYRLGSDRHLHTGHVTTKKTFSLCTTGDFNYDGKDELAFYRKSDGRIVIYKPDGTTASGFSEAGIIGTGIRSYDLMSTVDYDHDGCPEIVLYSHKLNHTVNIYRADSDTPVHSSRVTTKVPFTMLSTGDFDGDGKDELAFYHRSGFVTCYDVEGEYNSAGHGKNFQIGSNLKLMSTLKFNVADF